MALQVHISKPLKQLLPVVPALLLAPLRRQSILPVPPLVSRLVRVPPLAVPPLVVRSPAIVQPIVPLLPVVPVLLGYLRFVIRLRPGREVVMNFLFNGLLRRKPPLYGVQGPSGRAPVRGVVLLPISRVPQPFHRTFAVIVAALELWRHRVRVHVLPIAVVLVFAVALQSGSRSRVARVKGRNCRIELYRISGAELLGCGLQT